MTVESQIAAEKTCRGDDRAPLDAAALRDGPSAASECPSPLSWTEVLENFRAQSRTWTVTQGARVIHGRTFGEGHPLYFMNGIAGSCELFCLLFWLLRDEFRCVSFDYPAAPVGRGPKLTPDDLVNGLAAAADLHGDATFSLFATSFGSVPALTALHDRPDRVERAVLQGGFARRRLSPVERLLCRLSARLPGSLANVPFREAVHRANHRRYFPPFDHSRWQFFTEDAGRTPIRDIAERAEMVARFDFREKLHEVSQPVLLIASENEGLVSAGCLGELERGLPHATTEWLPLSGHLSYLTHPHRLAKCLRSFLLPSSAGDQRPGCGESCGNDEEETGTTDQGPFENRVSSGQNCRPAE